MRISDWSSDVCSSDLHRARHGDAGDGDGADELDVVDLDILLGDQPVAEARALDRHEGVDRPAFRMRGLGPEGVEVAVTVFAGLAHDFAVSLAARLSLRAGTPSERL